MFSATNNVRENSEIKVKIFVLVSTLYILP